MERKLVVRVMEIERQVKDSYQLKFSSIAYMNTGDYHAWGLKPMTFLRQVLAASLDNRLIASGDIREDVKEHNQILWESISPSDSVGSYADGLGIEAATRYVA